MEKPYLLIDVDGVLNALGIFSDEYEAEAFESVHTAGTGRHVHTLRVPVGTRDRLRRLTEVYEPVWCTAWQENAHAAFLDRLEYEVCGHCFDGSLDPEGFTPTCPDCEGHGVRRWPHIEFSNWNGMLAEGCNWKWPWVLPWLNERGRPAVWIDDDFSADDIGWANQADHGLAIHRVAPAKGLTELDTQILLDHASRLS